MDLRQLRYFAQIVESGSLSKASRQLFIAQPALSQQVSKLEEEVGKPLLNRSSKGVAPTRASPGPRWWTPTRRRTHCRRSTRSSRRYVLRQSPSAPPTASCTRRSANAV